MSGQGLTIIVHQECQIVSLSNLLKDHLDLKMINRFSRKTITIDSKPLKPYICKS